MISLSEARNCFVSFLGEAMPFDAQNPQLGRPADPGLAVGRLGRSLFFDQSTLRLPALSIKAHDLQFSDGAVVLWHGRDGDAWQEHG
jgi:hypothetical protein